jgi:ethanolamine transporter EutH
MPESAIDKIKRWLAQITEIGLLLVALAIVAQILVGDNLGFFGNVVGNLIAIINQLGDNGLVGLIAIAIILWLFAKRNPG